jgi:hypothetical protein
MVLDAAHRLSHTSEPTNDSTEIRMQMLAPTGVNEWSALLWPATCTCTNVLNSSAILAQLPKSQSLFLNLVAPTKQPRLPIQPPASLTIPAQRQGRTTY